uniref:Uncharacterized protein n=1 Tax=Lactuca sativa TaxID=4236 RepID=A0A9R1XN51_LACSA|nr:hypothetical protein LSAT_V11C400170220 [Lactuca sativa]
MGTRTNFYKNPSFTYNKDYDLNSVLQNLKDNKSSIFMSSNAHTTQSFCWFEDFYYFNLTAYNAATGNPTLPDDESASSKGKCPLQSNRLQAVEEGSGSASGGRLVLGYDSYASSDFSEGEETKDHLPQSTGCSCLFVLAFSN